MTTTPTPRPGSVATMRAITTQAYGSADVLALTQVARRSPAENEVLVRVHAAGVDRGAWHMMTGRPYLGAARVRAPHAQEPGAGHRGRRHRRGRRLGGDPVRGRRRGVRLRDGLVRRVRRRPRGQARREAERT